MQSRLNMRNIEDFLQFTLCGLLPNRQHRPRENKSPGRQTRSRRRTRSTSPQEERILSSDSEHSTIQDSSNSQKHLYQTQQNGEFSGHTPLSLPHRRMFRKARTHKARHRRVRNPAPQENLGDDEVDSPVTRRLNTSRESSETDEESDPTLEANPENLRYQSAQPLKKQRSPPQVDPTTKLLLYITLPFLLLITISQMWLMLKLS